MPRPPSSRRRIPSRIRWRTARGSSRSNPSRARADRRLDEVAPLPRGEAAVDLLEPGEKPRNRDGALSDVEDLRPGVAEVDDELLHLAEPRGRHAEEAVEHGRLAAGLVDEREASSRRAGERAFGDEGREGRGEQRVDGISTLAQDARAGLGRQRMTGCDRASHPKRVNRADFACRGVRKRALRRLRGSACRSPHRELELEPIAVAARFMCVIASPRMFCSASSSALPGGGRGGVLGQSTP